MKRHDPGNGRGESLNLGWGLAPEGTGEVTPEMMRQVWARRAAKLAEVPAEEDKGEQMDLVLVRLGREVYGLDAQYISTIRPVDQLTPVPRVPAWVAGVVNVRGRILSVVDLRRFFGLPADGNDRSDVVGAAQLVVVETPGMEVALLTQEVLTIEALPASRLEDAAGTVRGLQPEYVCGVAETNGRTATGGMGTMLVVLDLPALLADKRLIIHEEIA